MRVIWDRSGDFSVMFLVSGEHGLVSWEEDWEENFRSKMFQICVEAMEMKSVEVMLREVSIEQ